MPSLNAYHYYKMMGWVEALEYVLRSFTLNEYAKSMINGKIDLLEDQLRDYRHPLTEYSPPPPTSKELELRAIRAKKRQQLEERVAAARGEAMFINEAGQAGKETP